MLAISTEPNLAIFVTTLHFCRWCRQHTRHELRGSEMLCLDCASQALVRELDRD